jgi:hypothetical protein
VIVSYLGFSKSQSENLELLATTTTGLALADQGCIAKGFGKDFCSYLISIYLSQIPHLVRAASRNGVDVYVRYLSALLLEYLAPDQVVEDLLTREFGDRSRSW